VLRAVYQHSGCGAEQLSAPAAGRTLLAFQRRYSLYLFYWYKSTNTDAGGASNEGVVSAVANLLSILVSMAQEAKPVLTLLALLVQKYKY
jgi:hypothetical protein